MSIEARIEYVTTDDGVSLACTKFGSGPPLIFQFGNPSASHFEMELAFAPALFTYEAIARVATVIRYDPRNTGLSTRGIADVSVDAQLRDLDAVRRHFGLDAVALMFPFTWARVAVEYAAAYPERVTALLLPQPRLHNEDSVLRRRFTDLVDAARALGPEVYASIRTVLSLGLEAHENAAWFTRYMIESADFDDMLRSEAAIGQHDARAAAAGVLAPTLLLHRRLPRYTFGPASEEMIREHRANVTRLSAMIPGAQSSMFDGSSIWYSGDEQITARMVEFLTQVFATSNPAIGSAPAGAARSLRTVLFTDIVGHTEMMQRLGDTKGRDVLREHERITRETLKTHSGAEVKTMGDGFMASFGSVTSAMECAIALQRAFASHTESMPEPLNVRVGLNAGEPIEEDGDLFGATVILASRIAAKAGAGEILIPEPVRHLLSGKAFTFSDRGEYEMKGFDDAVRLYEVRWQA
jgi:class 3 adenylate cyclase/pimeloyl-ACP methyl ester carboxylesterase